MLWSLLPIRKGNLKIAVIVLVIHSLLIIVAALGFGNIRSFLMILDFAIIIMMSKTVSGNNILFNLLWLGGFLWFAISLYFCSWISLLAGKKTDIQIKQNIKSNTCKKCGEPNNPSFVNCWKCSTALN